jgi:hypothetical protein
MRTVAIEFAIALLTPIVAAGQTAVIVIDLGNARPDWVTGGARAAPGLHRFCSEGVSALSLHADMTKSPFELLKTLFLPPEGSLLARRGKDSWMLASAAIPFRDLAGGGRFFAGDMGAGSWRDLQIRYGLCGPTTAGELRAADLVRARFGPPLAEGEKTAAAALCAGTLGPSADGALLPPFEKLMERRPPLVTVVAWDLQGSAEDGLAARREALFERVYETLSAPGMRESAWFFFISLPPPLAARGSVGAAAEKAALPSATGAAVLWGAHIRRGLVSFQPVSWTCLSATILTVLGIRKDARPEDIVPDFLQP